MSAPLAAAYWPRQFDTSPASRGGSLPGVSFPVDARVELELGGVWVDVTRYVLQGTQIVITRGRPNEAGVAAPGACTMTLNDGPPPDGGDGRFSPRNPLGAYAGLLGRNTPIRVTAAGRSRFVGVMASLTPEWNIPHSVRVVKVAAGGVLRRLGQGASPLQSSLRRWVPRQAAASGLVHYWPLTDGPLSDVGQPVVGSTPMVLTPRLAPSAYWGQGSLGSVFDPAALALHGGDKVSAAVSMPDVGLWSVHWVRASEHGSDATLEAYQRLFGSWRVTFHSDTDISVTRPNGVALHYGIIPGEQVGADSAAHYVAFTCRQLGADVLFSLQVDGLTILSDFYTGVTLQPLGRIELTDAAAHTDRHSIGHVSVWAGRPDQVATAVAAFGYQGIQIGGFVVAPETAGQRLARLCAEENIPFTYTGDLDATEPMGPQRPLPLVQLLAECEAADQGTLSESRTVKDGLHYRTRASLHNQLPAVVLDYAAEQLAPPLQPVDDDQGTRNQVTVRRADGGEHTARLATGALSVQPPPDGVGVYDTSVTLNLDDHTQAQHAAGWLLHLGTVDETRYPKITVNLRSVGPTLAAAVLDADLDDLLVIRNASAIHVYDDIRQLGRGYTEILDTAYRYSIIWNTAPAVAYDVFVVEDPVLGRVDTAGSELATGAASGATSLSVATTAGPVWSTTAAPFDIGVGGERMTVTAVTGAASPQAFTVLRSVNGVVRDQVAGEPVRLFSRHVIAHGHA